MTEYYIKNKKNSRNFVIKRNHIPDMNLGKLLYNTLKNPF